MKYVLYIDNRASAHPSIEYRPLDAKSIAEAVVEADAIHDLDTMYLIRIMEKNGKIEKVESDITAQSYKAILEKRSLKWVFMESNHTVKHFKARFVDWFDLV